MTSDELARRVLDLSDAELFGAARAPLEAREERLLDEDVEALALAGPAAVSLARARTLPLALALRCTGVRAWEVPRDENTTLVAMDLDRRELRFGAVFHDPRLEEHPPRVEATRRPRPTGSSVLAGVYRVDARSVLALPWREARLRLVVLGYDWVSNLVDVELVGDALRPEGIVRAPDPLPAGERDDAAALPTYVPQAIGPLGEDARLVLGRDARGVLVLEGDFSVPAVDALRVVERRELVEADGVARMVVGVVPVTVAGLVLGAPLPACLELAVPIYEDASDATALRGHFRVEAPPQWSGAVAGTLRLYAFVEGRVTGPVGA